MWAVTNLLLCCFVAAIAEDEVILKVDMPYLRVKLGDQAALECCYTTKDESLKSTWFVRFIRHNVSDPIYPVNSSDSVTTGNKSGTGKLCGTLSLKSVQLSDSGFYQCLLNNSKIQLFSRGTYLQVYKPLEKTINLSEDTKNKILTAEGILLLLCVLLPSFTILCQSKKLHQLERKKMKKEEENIYQGLNLDDCCAAYDQIEHSRANGPYQDVCNIAEDEEKIQFEKP